MIPITQTKFEKYIAPLLTAAFWRMLSDYVGLGKTKQSEAIIDIDSMAKFIESRASHVAQTSLYGYLRTRAGTRFPELFDSPVILSSINIAKWQVWLACISDLSIFCGQCCYQSGKVDLDRIGQLLPAAVAQILDKTGEPEEAGPDFVTSREKVIQRIASHQWKIAGDDDTVFSRSPEALFYWSPVADELKDKDQGIVINSVRFRWIEIRRAARGLLNFDALGQKLDSTEVEADKSKVSA